MPSSSQQTMATLGGWYLFFGAIHEASHILTALAIHSSSSVHAPSFGFEDVLAVNGGSVAGLLFNIIIGRQAHLPMPSSDSRIYWTVRHMGWIFSALLCVTMWVHRKQSINAGFGLFLSDPVLYAAAIVALEAISTDLLGLNPLLPMAMDMANSSSNHNTMSENGEQVLLTTATFFCGNFGIILLHHNWLSHANGEAAMEVLERMVRVTMMRGAQSGGVITYYPDGKNPKADLVGIRSRVVNRKRTNLSKLIRAKVEKDVFSKRNRFPDSDFVPIMSGHTRFATTSISTMDGTHPHIWTPPATLRVYDMTKPYEVLAKEGPVVNRRVENYITHNGDFDFYTVNGISYDLDVVQSWLEMVTHTPMPSTVDSCAVAGMVDVLRTQGCFGLSARYALALGLPGSVIEESMSVPFPDYAFFEQLGQVFEAEFQKYHDDASTLMNLDTFIGRNDLARNVSLQIEKKRGQLLDTLLNIVQSDVAGRIEEGGASSTNATLSDFCKATLDAFMDNDVFFTTKTFLRSAKGSFGLVVSSSLDARRQICIAAQGQSMSIAFYPSKGLVCFGSEQAAVKSGMNTPFPGGSEDLETSNRDVDLDSLRLDLDDLGGEVVLLDWSKHTKSSQPIVSVPNRGLVQHSMMNGTVSLITYRLDGSAGQTSNLVQLYHRTTSLSRNALIKPLKEDSEDPILDDINDIPAVCKKIQDEFQPTKAHCSLNRLAAYNLSSCLRRRLDKKLKGDCLGSVDVLLTGCEVSLWLAEQFGSDLQKAFPKLKIQAVSSNKLLGLFGQEMAIPALGFPYSDQTQDLKNTIIIIVSQSGGTFAPLNCSNLLQSSSSNLFVVTSEWDTQIGKQLRSIDNDDSMAKVLNCRTFTTEVGMRPAEPSSVSVVATHQLLTNLFEYLSVVILSDTRYRNVTGAIITEQDLQILERCNQLNLSALSDIIGVNEHGKLIASPKGGDGPDATLREAGDLWAEHILENARAYIMSFVYVFATVVSGFPIVSAIAYAAGLSSSSYFMYLIRLVDAAIYFWLPQINITLIRIIQGRNLLHRMVGRTVVIGDIPWVSQSAEAFLSKIFACSYSIAGLNVLSGNAADHLVHRHTHRVVRGALVICGRPDGRLSALSTAEASTCLAVNQASSIQSWGGTCESITIGHNPFKLPLTKTAIFLKRKRPLFLCERMLIESDTKERTEKGDLGDDMMSQHSQSSKSSAHSSRKSFKPMKSVHNVFKRKSTFGSSQKQVEEDPELNGSVHPSAMKNRSAVALLGAYSNFEGKSNKRLIQLDTPPPDEPKRKSRQSVVLSHQSMGSTLRSLRQSAYVPALTEEPTDTNEHAIDINFIISRSITKRKFSDRLQKLFDTLDEDQDGFLCENDFLNLPNHSNLQLSPERLSEIFQEADGDKTGRIDYGELVGILSKYNISDDTLVLPPSNRTANGVIQVDASREVYFGSMVRKYNSGKARSSDVDFSVAKSQHFAQELYETRIASLQRFVAMTVMFHQMGKRVQKFFEIISFGFWTYRMDRTHSIMRIATTASPVSGADVREQIRYIRLQKKVEHSLNVIATAYLRYKARKEAARIEALEKRAMMLDENAAYMDTVELAEHQQREQQQQRRTGRRMGTEDTAE